MHLYCDALHTLQNSLLKPRQRRLAVRMITDFVSFICNLKAVL
ncbi:hypothetical protein [Streptococcus pneumoniae]|nr:hypothetical protein [Streptococcus pneumoniae]